MHMKHGNTNIVERDLVVLQLNTSNSNFHSKIEDLKVTVNEHEADIVLISESNIDIENQEHLILRET